MEILELNMKHFGKFQEHTVKLLPGVNIIYGGNETGKTTIHAFIRAMFFGIERGRGKAGRKDEYQLRQPWENPTYFAGTMRVKYGGMIYRIERNFYKSEKDAHLICETTGEELSVENGEISALLSGMSEAAFRNTVFVPQAACETDEGLAEELQKFMMNFQETGDGSLDVAKAIERLKSQRKKLEGKKKQEQEILDEKIVRKQMEMDYIKRELELKKERSGCLEKPEQNLTGGKGRAAETGAENSMKHEGADLLQSGIGKFQEQSEEIQKESSGFYNKFLLWLNVLLFLCAGLGIACGVFALSLAMRISMFAIGAVFLVLFSLTMKYTIANRRKIFRKRKGHPTLDFEETDLRKQRKELGMTDLQNQSKERWKQEEYQKELQEKNVQLQVIRDEMEELYRQREQLISYDREIEAIDLAMVRIKELSTQIYREAGAEFNNTASNILSDLTEGRYTHLALDEKMQIRINTPSHLLYLHQVSYGTMNQIYFALRMAAGNLLSGGCPVPIILDEAFAMYDDERLAEALRWLDTCGRQVILFTCQTREKVILDQIRQEQRRKHR